MSSERPDEPAHWRSLARAFAGCNKKKGCRWRLSPNYLYQFMWCRYLSPMRAANNQASLHIRIVSPDNVWKLIFLWVTRFVIHLREKWKKGNLPSQHMHKCKPEIRPASFVTMVDVSIYCYKIVHTMMKLLSTTWQTCINALYYASLKYNWALNYRIEGTETVNFKMF